MLTEFLRANGYGKDVIYLDMSRQISRSFLNAEEAAGQIKEQYPHQRFYLVDTCCVSGGSDCYCITWSDARRRKSFDE